MNTRDDNTIPVKDNPLKDNPLKQDLQTLMDDLYQVEAVHGEVTDTEVREQMGEAIDRGFILAATGDDEGDAPYVLPQEFGMFSAQGNRQVRQTLERFLQQARGTAARAGLATPQQRLAAFQDPSVRAAEDRSYGQYFGHQEEIHLGSSVQN